jgi:hypothetical protein
MSRHHSTNAQPAKRPEETAHEPDLDLRFPDNWRPTDAAVRYIARLLIDLADRQHKDNEKCAALSSPPPT